MVEGVIRGAPNRLVGRPQVLVRNARSPIPRKPRRGQLKDSHEASIDCQRDFVRAGLRLCTAGLPFYHEDESTCLAGCEKSQSARVGWGQRWLSERGQLGFDVSS